MQLISDEPLSPLVFYLDQLDITLEWKTQTKCIVRFFLNKKLN